MTREEAIKWLKGIQGCYKKKYFDIDLLNGLCVEAVDMAISALHREEAEANGWCRRINAEPMQHHLGKSADICVIDEPNEAVDKNDEVIDHDRDWIIGCLEHDGFIHTDRFDKANQIIHDALSAEDVQGWIPCSERLPDVDVEVLATTDWSDVRIAWLKKGGTWETDDYILDHDEIIAWMPLPKAYKGGDTE